MCCWVWIKTCASVCGCLKERKSRNWPQEKDFSFKRCFLKCIILYKQYDCWQKMSALNYLPSKSSSLVTFTSCFLSLICVLSFFFHLLIYLPHTLSSTLLHPSKQSHSSFNTPGLSSHVVPPCLPHSSLSPSLLPARHRAVREHLENLFKFVCLSCCHPNLPKTPTTESWQDVLQLALQRKVTFRCSRWSWLANFSRTFATTENVIYQPGSVHCLWQHDAFDSVVVAELSVCGCGEVGTAQLNHFMQYITLYQCSRLHRSLDVCG